jgi:pimeloyl-ACP methyl ester carboxylesterase
MIIEDYDGTLKNRMDKLDRLLSDKTSVVIVGSSFGGLMGALFACQNPIRVRKLVLLAPALSAKEFEPYLKRRIDVPVTIFHGSNDDVIPAGPVHETARRIFRNLTFHLVEDDHLLRRTFNSMDWDTLVAAET